MSSTLRPCQSDASSAMILRSTSLPNSSSKSFFKSDNCRGSALVSSAASSTRFTSCTSNDSESMGRFHINRRIRLLLRHFDQSLARELENRKECHNELRHAVSRTEQLRELDKFHVLQPSQDCAHV